MLQQSDNIQLTQRLTSFILKQKYVKYCKNCVSL